MLGTQTLQTPPIMPYPTSFPAPQRGAMNVNSMGSGSQVVVDSDFEVTPPPPASDTELLIAVMGATGSGKTTFINTISGSTMRIGKGLRSCTNKVQIAQSFPLDGRDIVLIDTPGFDDTTKSDTDILRMIAAFLTTTYEHGMRLAGVIYIHRISDFRMGGISTRNFRMFRELCGDSSLKNVAIVTNMWSQVSLEVGEAREKELASDPLFFQPVLEKGAQMVRHDNTLASAENILRYFLDNHPLTLQIQRELVDEGKDISQTAAGAELNRELMEQMKKHRAEMVQLQREMKDAMRAKDEETKKEIEAEARKLQAEMNRIQEDSQKLASTYKAEKEALESKFTKMEEDQRKQRERDAEEYRQKVSALEGALKDSSTRSDAERRELTRQLQELRNRPTPRRGGLFSAIGNFLDGLFGM